MKTCKNVQAKLGLFIFLEPIKEINIGFMINRGKPWNIFNIFCKIKCIFSLSGIKIDKNFISFVQIMEKKSLVASSTLCFDDKKRKKYKKLGFVTKLSFIWKLQLNDYKNLNLIGTKFIDLLMDIRLQLNILVEKKF